MNGLDDWWAVGGIHYCKCHAFLLNSMVAYPIYIWNMHYVLIKHDTVLNGLIDIWECSRTWYYGIPNYMDKSIENWILFIRSVYTIEGYMFVL